MQTLSRKAGTMTYSKWQRKMIICKTFFAISQRITAALLCNRLWPCGARQQLRKSGSYPKPWCWMYEMHSLYFVVPELCMWESSVQTLSGNILYKVTYDYFTVALTTEDKFCITWITVIIQILCELMTQWWDRWFRYNSHVSHHFDTLWSGRDFEET